MGVEENKAIIRRVNMEIARGNLDVIDQCYDPNYISHMPVPGVSETTSKDQEKQMLAMFLVAFSDFHTTVEDIVAEGDLVAWRGTNYGTHKAEFMGIPPSGKQISTGVISITRFENGKIAENWNVSDSLGMMQQLGLIPAPGQAG